MESFPEKNVTNFNKQFGFIASYKIQMMDFYLGKKWRFQLSATKSGFDVFKVAA